MELKYTDNVQEWTRKLRTAGFSLQEAGAQACTMAARHIADKYRMEMKNTIVTMRNKSFTMRAITVYPAKHISKSTGKLRPIGDINAVVGVKKIGDREHYLAMLEVGADKKKAGGVPIPLDPAREGENRAKPVATNMRIQGRGTSRGVIDLSRFAGNPRKQFAIVSSMARRGKLGKKGFYAVDHGDKKWLYQIQGKTARIVRDMSEELVKIQANPMFARSVDDVNQSGMETYFMRSAMILLGSLD